MSGGHGSPDRTVRAAVVTGTFGVVGVVLAAALGAVLGSTGRAPGLAAPSPSVSVSTTTVTVTADPRDGSTPITTPAASGAVASKIYHEGPLSLPNAQADLDAPPTDKQWDLTNLAQGTEGDVLAANEELYFYNEAQGFALKSADDSTCPNATGYSSDTISTQGLRKGFVCVATNQQRYALLRVRSIGDHIEFYVRTYKNSGD